MRTRFISLCVFAMMSIAKSFGGVTLTVPEVNIAPGTTSYVVINFDCGSQAYTAYQFDIAYPEGISSVSNNEKPEFIKGDIHKNGDGGHSVSSGYAPDGKARFQCFSIDSEPFTAQNGTLLILHIKAAKSLAEGTYQATISPIEFTQTDATPDRPDAVTFNIKVSNFVVLDETSTTTPEAATGVNVNVKRTIAAGTWSTICLPFAMTETQVKAAFGDDVEVADFTSWSSEEDDDENIVEINVGFTSKPFIEANHPYIIKTSSAISEFSVDLVNIEPKEAVVDFGKSKTKGTFTGTYLANTEVPKFNLFLSGGKFWYSIGKTKMKAFRAYFEFRDVLTEVEEGTYASRVKLSVTDNDGNTTKIDARTMEPIETGKVYNIAGQYVGEGEDMNRLPKGIYIVNGKKVIK